MKKKMLSLTLALALCLGLTVPVFAKALEDATKQDIFNTFTIYRNGSIDETDGDYLVDTPFKLLGLEDRAIEKEGYYVISMDDSWTITNTGSKELSASDNTDYDLLIQLYIYYPDGGVNDEYIFADHCCWSNENIFSDTDYLTVVRLKAGESATIPASAFMTAGGHESDSSPIYELYIEPRYQEVFDDWQYYKRYYSDIQRVLRSGSFYFLIDEDETARINASMAGTEEPSETETPGVTFTDVKETDWFYSDVQWAVKNGWVNGNGDGTFTPEEVCNEEMILTLLHHTKDSPAPTVTAPVTVDSWYQDAVNWAYEQEIIDDTFQPDTPGTRSKAIYYLWKVYGSESAGNEVSFTDVPEDADYMEALAWAVKAGIVEGSGDGTFDPDGAFQRGHLVRFVHRVIDHAVRVNVND